jgi:hypothetical protein
MNNISRTILVIARKKIKETFVSPVFYIIVTCGFLAAYSIFSGFIDTIKSDGINPEQNPLYEILFSFLTGIFGSSYPERLFAEGPFTLALYVSTLPFIMYLSFSSLFKLGYEKITGALELVVCGPVGVHSYLLGSFIRNLFFTITYSTAITLLSGLGAFITNTVPGPVFFASLLMLLLLSLALFSLCLFCPVISRYGFASLTFFVVITVFFIVIQTGTLASAQGYVRTVWSAVSGIIQFISPLFYFMNGLAAIDYGDAGGYLFNSFILILISGLLTAGGYLISQKKGVAL